MIQSIDEVVASFQERVVSFQAQSLAAGKKYNQLSIIRTVVFLVAVISLIYFANIRNYVLVTSIAVVFPFIFGILLKIHQKIAYQRAHAQFIASINESEVLRLQGNLKKFDAGERFLKEHHPYAIDLDVFGSNSLFQLLNRCTTESAKHKLSLWLSKAGTREEIIERQEAVRELTPMLEWRQDFQASGMHYEDKESNIYDLLTWLATPVYFQKKFSYKLAAYLFPPLSLVLISLYFTGAIHYIFPLIALVAGILIMRRAVPLATQTQEATFRSIKALKAFRTMIGKMEGQPFKAERLKSLQQRFSHDDFSAKQEINKLQKILDWLNSRSNAFYFLFNLIFLIDIHLLLKAERWKIRTEVDVSQWFEAISEMEVLISLAGLAYANPDYVFPNLSSTPHLFDGKSLGHPLLKKKSRVTNDFHFQGKGSIIVLTGSNMSGKSTFLRTVGTNAVLALMGSVVSASELHIGPFSAVYQHEDGRLSGRKRLLLLCGVTKIKAASGFYQ